MKSYKKKSIKSYSIQVYDQNWRKLLKNTSLIAIHDKPKIKNIPIAQ